MNGLNGRSGQEAFKHLHLGVVARSCRIFLTFQEFPFPTGSSLFFLIPSIQTTMKPLLLLSWIDKHVELSWSCSNTWDLWKAWTLTSLCTLIGDRCDCRLFTTTHFGHSLKCKPVSKNKERKQIHGFVWTSFLESPAALMVGTPVIWKLNFCTTCWVNFGSSGSKQINYSYPRRHQTPKKWDQPRDLGFCLSFGGLG